MLRSRRCGVLGSFLDTEDRKYFRQNVDRSLLYLLGTEAAERVPDHRVAVIGIAVAPRHRVSRGSKRVRDDCRCRNAPFLEDRAVGHTGRAARPSITYGGNDDVTLFGHLIGNSVLDRVGEPAPFRARHDRLDRVTFLEQVADGGEQVRPR